MLSKLPLNIGECILILKEILVVHGNCPSLCHTARERAQFTRKYESALNNLNMALLSIESADRL